MRKAKRRTLGGASEVRASGAESEGGTAADTAADAAWASAAGVASIATVAAVSAASPAASPRRRISGPPTRSGRNGIFTSSLRVMAPQHVRIDIDIGPEVTLIEILVVADQPGLRDVGEDAVRLHLVRHVGHDEALHLRHHRIALRAVRHRVLLLIEPVVLGQVE